MMATLFIIYIAVRCKLQPHLGPPLSKEERDAIPGKSAYSLMRAGFLPFMIIFADDGARSSTAGPAWSKAPRRRAGLVGLAAFIKGRMTRR
jgi:hypothetical protein